MMTKRCICFLAILFVASISGGVSIAQSETDLKLRSQSQALLIGFSKFELKGNDMSSVEKDIATLRPVLLKNQYDVVRYIPGEGLQTSDGNSEQMYSVKTNDAVRDQYSTHETDLLKTSIRIFLKSVPRTTKTAVIYVSTHGIVTNDGLFFAVTDTTVSEQFTMRDDGVKVYEKAGGLSYNWLFQEVKDCPFDVVLIFDVCHAGEGNVPNLSDIGKSKATGNCVIILARCRREQKASVNTDYSHWLSLGLQGFADTRTVDGRVDVDELHEFVLQRFQLHPDREKPMKFMLGAAQNPVVAQSILPLSQDELMMAFAREIDFELQFAKDTILNSTDNQDKRICVCVPEFQATPYANLQGDGHNYEIVRKQLGRKLAEYLNRFSEKSGNYRIVSFDEVQKKLKLRDNHRTTLNDFSHLEDSPFIWINGTIEPFDKKKADSTLTKAFEVVGINEKSILHISCDIHRKERSIPLTRWGGLMNYIVQNLDDRIESYPVTIAPQIIPGTDPGDPSMFAAITVDHINENATQPQPASELLNNPLLEPMILVKNANAPPMKSNPTAQEYSAYISNNYAKRKLTVMENNELRVDLKTDEEFIIILNVRKRPADIPWESDPKVNKPYLFARVLIDGRNTVAQAIPPNEALILEDGYKSAFRSAESTYVRNAEPWYIASDGAMAVIPGFTSKEDRFPRAFRMTDQAVRDKEGKTISDYTGLIQIIAYLPELPGTHRGVVMPGEKIDHKVQLIDTPYVPGDMVGAWVIQYGK
ncbi:MAG: caspase family protein [Planctomycetaceae bacterium]|nr:caspase family protein [Planctomycetaceae bacterium]